MPAYYLETIVVSIGLLMLLIEAFAPVGDKRSIAWLGVLGIIVVLCLLFKVEPHAVPTDGSEAHVFWTFYSDDGLALFFKGLTLACTLIVLLMSVDFAPTLKRYLAPGEPGASKDAGVGEFYALPIFICAGLMWMASATHLVSIFVALETVTIGFYVLVAYMRRNVASLEAGVKYLILGALSTGFLVYGFTWLYGITGEFELGKIAAALASEETAAGQGPQLFAFALILIALGFKVGAVPFQLWIPDVYQGAPTPVTAFLSVGSKAAGFVVLIRLAEVFLESGAIAGQTLSIFVIIAGATLVYGNLAALPQTNFKRLLAYSSISHAGFLLMALTASEKYRDSSTPAIAFYLAAYLAMTLLAFLVMVAVRNQSDSDELSAYKGLGKRSPFLAFTLTVAMASLAGVPLTAGFFGKFFVFQVAVQNQHYLLLAIAIVAAAAGFYYYFKVIRAMYWEQPSDSGAAASDDDKDSAAMAPAPMLSAATRFVAVVLMIAVVVFGFYPQGILNLLN